MLYDELQARIRAEQPVCMATVIDGPSVGAKLLVDPDGPVLGTLGDAELDRIVTRDARAELEAGRSGVRHYGPHGETTPEDLMDKPSVSDIRTVPDGAGGRVLSGVRIRGDKTAHRVATN